MKKVLTITALLVGIVGTTGCSGLEIGGKAWIMKVDEAQSSQRTHAQPPLKCLFINCFEATESNEVAK